MSHYEPRTIAFGSEVVHTPVSIETPKVQSLHTDLFQQPEVGYQNFQIAQDGVHLTNLAQAPGQISSATVRPDRLIFREEFRSVTVEDFATRVVNFSRAAYESLSIPATLARQYWMRALIAPSHVADSRTLVAEHMLSADNLTAFGRPIASAGLRLVFPAEEGQRVGYQVRIEPWTQEPRSLWIEVVGQISSAVPAAEITGLGDELYEIYRFVTGPVLEYVSRHDRA